MPYSIVVETNGRTQFINVDQQLERAVTELGLMDGLLQVHVPHTTAGITINENADPDVWRDVELALNNAVPWRVPGFRHAEGNSAAHVKSSMMGQGLSLIVENGVIQLGQWQSVFFCEFDGPRTRRLWVHALPMR